MTLAAVCLAGNFLVLSSGCERKEKVIDIETPRGEIEVERTVKDRDVDVDIKVDDKASEGGK
jgi:hypothetical protein